MGRGHYCGATLLAVAFMLLVCSAAETYVVGDSKGWGDDSVSYDSWSAGKTFAAGDTLVFNYPAGEHKVVAVTASEYRSCKVTSSAAADAAAAATTMAAAATTTTAGKHPCGCNCTACTAARATTTSDAAATTSCGCGCGGDHHHPHESSSQPTTSDATATTSCGCGCGGDHHHPHESSSQPTTAASAATTISTTRFVLKRGTNYFICAVPSHCAAGMKLRVLAN
ncbi:hypothetical protein BS78_08G124100 [Paspalum vaginatum]|nr:hypothetical protein BS78_08G124100 [Paspalum vaginatum]